MFSQGHYYSSSEGKVKRWYTPQWINIDHVPSTPLDLTTIKVRP